MKAYAKAIEDDRVIHLEPGNAEAYYAQLARERSEQRIEAMPTTRRPMAATGDMPGAAGACQCAGRRGAAARRHRARPRRRRRSRSPETVKPAPVAARHDTPTCEAKPEAKPEPKPEAKPQRSPPRLPAAEKPVKRHGNAAGSAKRKNGTESSRARPREKTAKRIGRTQGGAARALLAHRRAPAAAARVERRRTTPALFRSAGPAVTATPDSPTRSAKRQLAALPPRDPASPAGDTIPGGVRRGWPAA